MKKRIFLIIIIFIVIFAVDDLFFPQPLEKLFNTSDIVEGTFFKSPYVKVNNKEYNVMSCVRRDSSEDNSESFHIYTTERYGILHNKEAVCTAFEVPLDRVLEPSYDVVAPIPEEEIKKGDHFYGYLYCGIVPSDCKEMTFDNNKAELEKIQITLNGVKTSFYLYYYIELTEEEWSRPEIICTDTNGEQHLNVGIIY